MPRHTCRFAVLLALIAPAPAAAQRFGQRPYALTVHAGTMRLDFHGDPASGCAERGLCATKGTVTSRTRTARGGLASLDLFGGHLHGRASGPAIGRTVARVSTPGAPDCTDSVPRSAHAFTLIGNHRGPVWAGYGTTLSISGETGGSEVAWVGPEGVHEPDRILETHCAGPRLEDFGVAFPAVRLSRRVIRERVVSIHLTGTRRFSGGGFAGTLTTDLRLTLRRVRCDRSQRSLCRAYDQQAHD